MNLCYLPSVDFNGPECWVYLVLSEQSLVVPSRDVQVVQEPEHLNLLRQGVNAPLDRVQDKTPQSFGRDFLQQKKSIQQQHIRLFLSVV